MSGSLNKKNSVKNLKKKGFVNSTTHSDDHIYLEFYHEGKMICYTKVSHSGKDISGGLLNAMARQIFLSKTDFVSFANCSISQEMYIQMLQRNNHI